MTPVVEEPAVEEAPAEEPVEETPVEEEPAAEETTEAEEPFPVDFKLNLESTNKDIARRLVDFLSGVAYASDGKIKRVAANTYIITPNSVDIMGDLIDELESSGLYM